MEMFMYVLIKQTEEDQSDANNKMDELNMRENIPQFPAW